MEWPSSELSASFCASYKPFFSTHANLPVLRHSNTFLRPLAPSTKNPKLPGLEMPGFME